MPHQNSVFHQVLHSLPWDALDRAVERHAGGVGVRRFSFKSQLVAMVQAQLAGASSLRHVELTQHSHRARLYHLGVQPVHRSTLADANRDRPAAVFTDVLGAMIAQAHRMQRRALAGVTYLIDSTSLILNARSADWARFSHNACGAKLHVVYDPDADQPIYAAVSAANVNDITAAQAMPIQAGCTYVFDLGYYDYAWWAKFDAASCRIVTRLKRNTALAVTEERAVTDPDILSDRVGLLPARQKKNRRNPFHKPVRELQVRIDTGKIIRIVTNDLTTPAVAIAELYKRRWAIELFFRWVKQTLKITQFLGTSENAVRIQIACALIAFLLLRMAQAVCAITASPLLFARLIRDNLMHRRSLDSLLRHPPPTNPCAGQLTLFQT